MSAEYAVNLFVTSVALVTDSTLSLSKLVRAVVRDESAAVLSEVSVDRAVVRDESAASLLEVSVDRAVVRDESAASLLEVSVDRAVVRDESAATLSEVSVDREVVRDESAACLSSISVDREVVSVSVVAVEFTTVQWFKLLFVAEASAISTVPPVRGTPNAVNASSTTYMSPTSGGSIVEKASKFSKPPL